MQREEALRLSGRLRILLGLAKLKQEDLQRRAVEVKDPAEGGARQPGCHSVCLWQWIPAMLKAHSTPVMAQTSVPSILGPHQIETGYDLTLIKPQSESS